jgi:broad-specificity NMP kinase
MSLVFVTGSPGVGKSSVCRELRTRGLEAYDTDADGLAGWYDKSSGQSVAMPSREVWATPEWQGQHDWHIDKNKVEAIAKTSQRDPVFICGSVANEVQVWDLFSKVFYLLSDETTVRARLLSRADNDFGKEAHELAAILGWLRNAEADYKRFGAEIIDATRPLEQVVDDIVSLSHCDGI